MLRNLQSDKFKSSVVFLGVMYHVVYLYVTSSVCLSAKPINVFIS